jgi:hypothetical protein
MPGVLKLSWAGKSSSFDYLELNTVTKLTLLITDLAKCQSCWTLRSAYSFSVLRNNEFQGQIVPPDLPRGPVPQLNH